ncbi:MAG: YceI family protein [Bdellovibrionales bacterium]|nr:YceI family protein [Bdellovibrionales bacterium]
MKLILSTILIISQFALAKAPAAKKTEAATPAPATLTLKAQAQSGAVTFEAVGKPSFLKIKGQGEGPEGNIQIDKNITGEFKFKLDTLNTGISLRDSHMKEKYLEVAKHPDARLKLEEVKDWSVEKGEAQGVPFKGSLTIHGVEKPVTGTVDIKKKDAGYAVVANFETKISLYGIDLPSYAGVTVADDVKVSVKTELL